MNTIKYVYEDKLCFVCFWCWCFLMVLIGFWWTGEFWKESRCPLCFIPGSTASYIDPCHCYWTCYVIHTWYLPLNNQKHHEELYSMMQREVFAQRNKFAAVWLYRCKSRLERICISRSNRTSFILRNVLLCSCLDILKSTCTCRLKYCYEILQRRYFLFW